MTEGVTVSPQIAALGVKSAQISLVVTRADGTVEDHGVVTSTNFARPSVLTRFRNWIGAR